MFGGAEYEDEICYKLAHETGFVVVSASYRLAPEFPFPTPVNDALNVLQWVSVFIEEFGAHSKKIIVAGEGAGGNLAAAAVARNLDSKVVDMDERVSVIGLLLVHPPLAMHSEGDADSSYAEYGHSNGRMTITQLDWEKAMYRSNSMVKPNDYTFAPLVASTQLLKLFPNTIFVLAKHDILFDENMKFSNILQSRYVPVERLVFNSTIYGFFGRSVFPQGDVAMRSACEKLRIISEVYPESFFVEDDEMGGSLPPFPDEFP